MRKRATLSWATLPAFAAAALGGAFLLFSIQPMVGRFVLPHYGGGSTVWSVCLLFFQLSLLAGYGLAHLVTIGLVRSRSAAAFLILIAASLLLLPLTPDVSTPAAGDVTLSLILLLVRAIGLPYLVLSAVAPLLQAWLAGAVEPGGSPYRLYAWSNAGSLLALLAYPLVIEPQLTLQEQARSWSTGYALLALLLAACTLTVRASAPGGRLAAGEPDDAPAPRRRQRLAWLALSATGCAMLVATTEMATQDIGAGSLLWVVPLGLYLTSFILCFGRPTWAGRRLWTPLLILTVVAQLWVLQAGPRADLLTQLGIYYLGLFAGCMALHGQLVRRRPHPSRLTGFYLTIALGGALGGVLVGGVAPRLLPLQLELHLTMIGTVILFFGLPLWELGRKVAAWVWALPLCGILLLAEGLRRQVADTLSDVIWLRRGPYGVLKIKEQPADDPGGPSRRLLHGRIMHGHQLYGERAARPISYYGPESGVGLLFRWGRGRPPRQMAVVGLGVGTIAAYGRPGDSLVFYELDPTVKLAAESWFSYLAASPATVRVVLGDGRVSLARAGRQRFDFLILDAFSADAIPAHLLTREAFSLYLSRLSARGVIAVNVSNLHLDLVPVLLDHGVHFGLDVFEISSSGDRLEGLRPARWALLSRSVELRQWLSEQRIAALSPTARRRQKWTDDYAPLLPLLKRLH